MASILSSVSGSVVVTDGPSLDIPGLDVDVKRDPCRITTTIIAVYYGGDNVGSEWQFDISVNNTVWPSGLRIVPHRTWDYLNKLIYDDVREGGCGLIELVTIGIRARERDWFIFDDIGIAVSMTFLECTDELTRNRVIVSVPVPEYPSGLWRTLFRKYKKTALLYFVFEVTANCVK